MDDRTGTTLDERSSDLSLVPGPPEPMSTRRGSSRRSPSLLGLVRWCMAHRRLVIVTWVAVAVLATLVAQSVGRDYATNFTLPGTESQRASDLLTHEFAAQSGDVDTIVFHVSHGTVDSPAARAAITPLLERVSTFADVAGIISPYSPRGAVQVSPDKRTAFATVELRQAREPAAEQYR